MQETIHAAHNLTIQIDPVAWRLYNGAQTPTALFEAQQDQIRCLPAFARARQIPRGGSLIPADIARVVLGWAPESHNWHLGLMLAAQPETDFKARWCGLASWPSGDAGEYMERARYAALSLARLIDRPFHLVPPSEPVRVVIDETQPIQATVRMETLPPAAVVPDILLQAPPFAFEEWTMNAVPRGYIWHRRSPWLVQTVLSIVGYVILIVLFLILGIGAETSGLAAVNPSWLPWLGLAVAGMLAVVTLANVIALLSAADVIIDTRAGEVRRQNRLSGMTRWRVPFSAISYVLISQTPPQGQGRKHAGDPVTTLQDVWIHLYDGQRFRPVVALEHVEGRCHDWDTARAVIKTPGRRPVKLARYDTPAHHAALVMGRALDTEVWLDIRS
jgi:hypothetical protein